MKRSRWIAVAGALIVILTGCGINGGTPTLPSNPLTIVESYAEVTAPTEASILPETEAVAVSTESIPETGEAAAQTEVPTKEPESVTEPEATAPTSSAQSTESAPAARTEAPKPSEAPKPTEPQKSAEPAHVHSYKATVVAPSCTAKGYTEHKCACGDSYKDGYTDALGHSFTEQTVAATCTSGGYTLRTCSRCGATETTNTTQALGHDYRDTVVPPTTSSEGYTEHKCSRCGDSYRDNYTEKLHEVFDLQAVIDYGCAYAKTLGFTIDKSMTLANSSYYPGYYGGGYSLEFLKTKVAENVQYTADMLIADGDSIPGFRCNIHATYEPNTDKYYIVVLYG